VSKMKSLKEIVDMLSDDEKEKFKDLIKETEDRELELNEIKKNSLKLNDRFEDMIKTYVETLKVMKVSLDELHSSAALLKSVLGKFEKNKGMKN
jgi:hypothetical protein